MLTSVTNIRHSRRNVNRHPSFWTLARLDESNGKVFCLAEAPNAEAAIATHREAHGLLADRAYEVVEGS